MAKKRSKSCSRFFLFELLHEAVIFLAAAIATELLGEVEWIKGATALLACEIEWAVAFRAFVHKHMAFVTVVSFTIYLFRVQHVM